MRDPNHLIEISTSNKKTVEIIKIDDIPEYDMEDYDFLDPKDQNKFILDIKADIRNSFEYRKYVNYLRENLDMNKCSFYENVTNIDTTKIKIHLHHEPFTIEDIIRTIFSKRVFYREKLDVELISKEVMYLHYKLLVGLIPLAETVHELVHNQYLFIPVNIVYGKYYDFVNEYEQFIPPETMDTYNRILEASKTLEINKGLLSKKYIYIDTTGTYDLPILDDIIKMLNNRISTIRENYQNNNILINPMIIRKDV